MMTIQIHRKPLSVNACWQGKRFKTPEYKAYEKEILLLLPNKYEIPEGDLQVRYEFGLNTMADWDNPVKPLQFPPANCMPSTWFCMGTAPQHEFSDKSAWMMQLWILPGL